ncbi:MAG: rRNA pseudouridine synthase [Saprospiraceae bacterium]|nr:rRNA pseudouridine synthase [Saprospiraceae bacterium]HMW38203.1 pseudouridine synthase [Saprospiraceae bacterium]HMX87398.1 pseudouridine synthase [Saprospiraceae bacterium]HMZ39225.1 pseudouridine synthase [Saprospiraceae bacterium]HNA63476.1 pseudouridine synthase [Saprospiraceae bacterium]
MMKTYRGNKERGERRETASSEKMRLNKFVAHCGICSRRQAAELVKDGKIKVNDRIELNPSYEVQDKDKIYYNNERIFPQTKKVYILLNKPKNYITTVKDEKTRNTVIDLVKDHIEERIYPVGRLDRNTTGVLLMTNDGELAQKLSHPSFKVKKIYHVALNKPLSKKDFETILSGLNLEDGKMEVDGMDYVENKKDELGVEIHSGKNRIIRRIFEHLGYEIKRLDRVYYAGLTKKSVARGKFRHLTTQEVITLKHFIK